MWRRIHRSRHQRRLMGASRATSAAWLLALLLDIGMMIVSIMAYTGATSEDDRPVIRRTRITFTQTGHIIQRLEIALASLGLLAHPTLLILVSLHDSSRDAVGARRVIACCMVPWHLVCLVAWIVCVVLQARYVPILGSRQLPECVAYGNALSQCGFVSASWIIAIIYCVYHFCLLVLVLAMMHWVQRVVVRQRWSLSQLLSPQRTPKPRSLSRSLSPTEVPKPRSLSRSLSPRRVRIVVEEEVPRRSKREGSVNRWLDGV